MLVFLTLLTHDGVIWGSDLFVDGVSVRDLFKRSLSSQLHLVMQILHTSPSMLNKATKLSREGKNSNHSCVSQSVWIYYIWTADENG